MKAALLKLPHGEEGWQDEWPTEPDSFWWFYGWQSKFCLANHPEPDLIMVEVRIMPAGNPYYVGHGAFMYEHEGGIGKWKRASAGCLPTLMKPEKK